MSNPPTDPSALQPTEGSGSPQPGHNEPPASAGPDYVPPGADARPYAPQAQPPPQQQGPGQYPPNGPGPFQGQGQYPPQGPGPFQGQGQYPPQGPGSFQGQGQYPPQGPGPFQGQGGYPPQGPGYQGGYGQFQGPPPPPGGTKGGKAARLIAIASLALLIIVAGVVFGPGLLASIGGGDSTPTPTSAPPTVGIVTPDPTTQQTTSTPTTDAPQPTDEPTQSKSPEAGDPGTRDNPLPLGSTVALEGWDVTVNSFTPNATDAVLAENQFNDVPEAGSNYALVNVTVKRTIAEEGYPFEVLASFVTDGGNVVDDSFAVVPEDLTLFSELYEGGEATGNIAFILPIDQAGTIRMRAGYSTDEEQFFAIS